MVPSWILWAAVAAKSPRRVVVVADVVDGLASPFRYQSVLNDQTLRGNRWPELSSSVGSPVGDALALSATSVDRCLWQLIGDDAARPPGPVTSAELHILLASGGRRLLVLDGLDADAGYDLRLRLLLAEVASGRLAEVSVLVVSRLQPPLRRLPSPSLRSSRSRPPTTCSSHQPQWPGPTPHRRYSRSSRWASSGWMQGMVTGLASDEPSLATSAGVTAEVVKEAGVVARVGSGHSGEWFQMHDILREGFLNGDRAREVHGAVADALQGDQARACLELAVMHDPEVYCDLVEGVIAHRLAAGDIRDAVALLLGVARQFFEFTRAREDPSRCARVPSAQRRLTATPGGGSQFAMCAGDARTAVAAARSVYRLGADADELRPWDRALLAHVSDALLRGELPVCAGETDTAGGRDAYRQVHDPPSIRTVRRPRDESGRRVKNLRLASHHRRHVQEPQRTREHRRPGVTGRA